MKKYYTHKYFVIYFYFESNNFPNIDKWKPFVFLFEFDGYVLNRDNICVKNNDGVSK